MDELEQILRALDERELTLQVGNKHDEARLRYPLAKNTVDNFPEFERIIGAYYAYHFAECIAPGAKLPAFEAQQRAKELLLQETRRTNGTLAQLSANAMDGMDGGVRRILDVICDGLKRESMARYMESVFDRYVAPNSFDDKVEIIRQLFARFGVMLRDVNTKRPEQYANDYKPIIQALIDQMRESARAFRRI